MTDQPRKILLYCKPGIDEEDLDPDEMIQVAVYGAVVIPADEEPSQDFIDAAWAEGMQLASYDYHPGEEDESQWDPRLFANGKVITDKLNNIIMARFN